jgi:hypothetical protein
MLGSFQLDISRPTTVTTTFVVGACPVSGSGEGDASGVLMTGDGSMVGGLPSP